MRLSCSTWLLSAVLLPTLASADRSVTVASPFANEETATDGVGSNPSLRQGTAAPTDGDVVGDDALEDICVEEEGPFYACLANENCDEDCQGAGFDDDVTGDDDGSVFNTLDYSDPDDINEVVNTYLETSCGKVKTGTCEAKQCCPQCAIEIDVYYTCLYETSNAALVAQFEEIEVPTVECSLEEVTCDELVDDDGPGGPGNGAGPGENGPPEDGPPGQNQTEFGNEGGPGGMFSEQNETDFGNFETDFGNDGGSGGMPPGRNETNPGNGVGPGGMPPGQNETNPGDGVGPGGMPPGQNQTNPGDGVGPGGMFPGQNETVGPVGIPPGQNQTNPGGSTSENNGMDPDEGGTGGIPPGMDEDRQTIAVNSTFLISSTTGKTAESMKSSLHSEVGLLALRNAYYDFVKGVIAGITSTGRRLQDVTIGDGSTDIYDFVDTPCPENDVATSVSRQAGVTCITVFGKYEVQVDEDQDAEEVYQAYVQATQQAISEGDLDEALDEAIMGLQSSTTNATAADFDFAVLGVSDVVDENFKPFAEVQDDSETASEGDDEGNDESDGNGDDDLLGLEEACETQEADRKACFDLNECAKCEDEWQSSDDDAITDDASSVLDDIDPADPDSIKNGLTTFLEETCIVAKADACLATTCCPKCETEIEAITKCYFDFAGPTITALFALGLGLGGANVSDLEVSDVTCNFEDNCSGAVAVVGNMIAAMLTAGSVMLML